MGIGLAAFANYYGWGWSIVSLVIMVFIVAVPIICLLLLLKMNRNLRRLEQRVVEIQVRELNS